MMFQSMPCSFTRGEWVETLRNAFNTESAVHEGHQYIYLNRTGQCKTFSSSSATHQEFNRKMTIGDIIETSQKYFADYAPCSGDEIRTLCHAFEIMDKGAQQSCWSRLIHFLRGLGFKTTHELIEEQLLQIVDQKIQRQYRILVKNLDDIKQTLSSLNDERFNQAYEGLFHQTKLWADAPARTLPKNYEGWKKRAGELNDLFLRSQQVVNFNQSVLSILKQQEQLTQLLQLHPHAPIKQEKLEEFASSLESLINQKLDKFSIHDDENQCKQKLNILKRNLEESISQLLADYRQQPNYQEDQVSEIVSPRARITSPLRGVIASRRQLFEGKEENRPREWGKD